MLLHSRQSMGRIEQLLVQVSIPSYRQAKTLLVATHHCT